MRIPRIYQPATLISGQQLELLPEAAHHVLNVLRMKDGQALILFNGEGGQFDALIERAGKRRVEVRIGEHHQQDCESPLHFTLAQAISRGKHMDLTLQKAVELGVSRFVPVHSEFSNIRLDPEQQHKRLEHWRRVVIAACEQCGRNRLPVIEAPQTLPEWLAGGVEALKLILHPRADVSPVDIHQQPTHVILLAGPEGGFSNEECDLAKTHGYLAIRLGPRILRTETAALVALAACQTLWGDLRTGE
ncbi:MAG TPA: 16S rRNA (uracil(1498)-N(3))-methyltransferase [Gammaproteobacteria bacterium]|nr:16S rRNA (uracil(1498)-N(3))-methyltransferase [Gammaproteobacteria bacterium]